MPGALRASLGGLGWFGFGALLRHRTRLFARALPDVVAQSSALRQLRFVLRIDFGFEVGLKVTERREGLGPGSKSPDSESLAHEKKKCSNSANTLGNLKNCQRCVNFSDKMGGAKSRLTSWGGVVTQPE